MKRWSATLAMTVALSVNASDFAAQACPCDCDGDRAVRVHEVTASVAIALDLLPLERCTASDADNDGLVEIAELIGGVDAALHGCPPEPTPTPSRADALAELQMNRERWRDEAPPSHRYRFQRVCFCPPPHAAEVQVIDGAITALLDPDSGEPLPTATADRFLTIPALFDVIEDALQRADVVAVEYEARWGAPSSVDIDYFEALADDELGLRISGLEASCRGSTDCDPFGSTCVEPGSHAACGICLDMPSECAGDDDCSNGQICEELGPEACTSCDGLPIFTCQDGCRSDDECGVGAACDPDGHCVAIRCSSDESCPAHFSCELPPGSRTGQCDRRPCSSDDDCPAGFCVEGACYGVLGTCQLPAP